jgi:hypothetical protein
MSNEEGGRHCTRGRLAQVPYSEPFPLKLKVPNKESKRLGMVRYSPEGVEGLDGAAEGGGAGGCAASYALGRGGRADDGGKRDGGHCFLDVRRGVATQFVAWRYDAVCE